MTQIVFDKLLKFIKFFITFCCVLFMHYAFIFDYSQLAQLTHFSQSLSQPLARFHDSIHYQQKIAFWKM